MKRRTSGSSWSRSFERGLVALTKLAAASGTRSLKQVLKPVAARRAPPPGDGAWIPGVAVGRSGALRFRLYRPPAVGHGERLPLMVMLHGCGQEASSFAASTRMNRIAQRERFLVLYPEQDRLANSQGCWNWFDTGSGRAYGEAELILKAVDQVCLLYPVDRSRVAVAGLSAGASMAALLGTRHPERFKAVVMHSGVPPGLAHSALTALSVMHGRRSQKSPASPAAGPATTPPGATAAPWPPLLVIHGDADTVVSPQNAHAAAAFWSDASGARAVAARSVQRGARYPVSVTDFKHHGRTVVSLVEVGGLAHAWSGGLAGKPHGDARGPDASRMAWAFAARQFAG